MKITAIRTITDADKKKVPATCGDTSGDGQDKPPC
jgi:hypothetical protein